MSANQKLSDKQKSLVEVIIKGNIDGTPCDIDQILERIAYTTTKQSLQFSLRSLIRRGLIVKSGIENRRSKDRVTYRALASAVRYLRV